MNKGLITCLLCLSIIAFASSKPNQDKVKMKIKRSGGQDKIMPKIVKDNKEVSKKEQSENKFMTISNIGTAIERSPDFMEGDIKMIPKEMQKKCRKNPRYIKF